MAKAKSLEKSMIRNIKKKIKFHEDAIRYLRDLLRYVS